MRKPEISVIMSVYNGEEYLSETMDSLLDQTFKDFELIIINDGSSDNTLKILKQYQKKDKRVIILDNRKNLGFITSLNKGLHAAKGKYIARMDGDDICMRERFQLQHEFLERHKDIFLLGTYAINIDKNGNKLSLFKPPVKPEAIAKTLERYNCMYHNTIMYRNTKEFYYRKKMYYVEDYDLYLNYLTMGKKLANLPEYLVKYRRLGNSASFSKKGKQELFSRKAREFYNQRKDRGYDDYDAFNPESILKLDVAKNFDKDILKTEINTQFALNNKLKVRALSRKYFRHYGYIHSPRIWFYYLTSYLNIGSLQFIKKVVLILKNKY